MIKYFLTMVLPLFHGLAVVLPASEHLGIVPMLLLYAMIPFYVLGFREAVNWVIKRFDLQL